MPKTKKANAKVTEAEKKRAAQAKLDEADGIAPDVRDAAEWIMQTLAANGRNQYAPAYAFRSLMKRDLDKAAIALLVTEYRLEPLRGAAQVFRVVTDEDREAKEKRTEKEKTAAVAIEDIKELAGEAFHISRALPDRTAAIVDPVQLRDWIQTVLNQSGSKPRGSGRKEPS